jgi:hypothetical protein
MDSIHAAPAISRPLLEGVKKAHPYLAKLDNAKITANRKRRVKADAAIPFKSCARTAISGETPSGPSPPDITMRMRSSSAPRRAQHLDELHQRSRQG